MLKWATPEKTEESKVHQQKLRVTYLPPDGQTLEEEDETTVHAQPSHMSTGDMVSLRCADCSSEPDITSSIPSVSILYPMVTMILSPDSMRLPLKMPVLTLPQLIS